MDYFIKNKKKGLFPYKKNFFRMKLTCFFLIIFLLQINAMGFTQNAVVTIKADNISLEQFFSEIEKQTDVKFFYRYENIAGKKVNIDSENVTLEEALSVALRTTGLYYSLMYDNLIVVGTDVKQQGITITGTVTDTDGQPLPGASIMIIGTSHGTITDNNGEYKLMIPDANTILLVSYLGYVNQEVEVGYRRTVNVTLIEDSRLIEEVVVVGYGVQKKVTLTGSVATIKGEDMVYTRNENAQNMLTGKVSGVRIHQVTAEPGSFQNNMDIRGMGTPLIVIDGIPREMGDFQRIDPNDIDNISVLKDGSAAVYGVRAANGVVLVTTKRGTVEGKPKLNYSGSFTFQMPSGLPRTIDTEDFMILRNEQAMNRVDGGYTIFSDELIEEYRNGTRKSTDWYPLVFSKWSPQTQHNLSITGGNERNSYFVGLGYQYQEGFFKSGDLKYDRYNIRANLTTKITERLSFDLKLNGIMDQQDRPYYDSWYIFYSYWRMGAHVPAYANSERTRLYQPLVDSYNPVAMMDKDISGYKKYNQKIFRSSATLKYDIPSINGLDVRVMFSFDHTVNNNTLFRKAYNQYRYDEVSDTYSTYWMQSPTTLRRENSMRTQMLTSLSLNYNHSFGVHQIAGVLVWEMQKRNADNFYAQRELDFPLEYLFTGRTTNQVANMNYGNNDLYINANEALIGKFNYSFSDKYLAEFIFRYDGSSKFAPGYQWGFFPAISIGWRISEEGFFKNLPLNFFDQFKIRTSYGKTGDDSASSYQFVSGHNYPTSSSNRFFTGGYVFDGTFTASADTRGIPNESITWFTAKTFEVGADLEAWRGLLGATFNYFSRTRNGLLAVRSGNIPTVVGASLPQENLNSDRTFGIELELSHKNKIGNLTYSASGLASITRIKRLDWDRAPDGSSWNNWRNNLSQNRLQGIQTGYQGTGRYETWDDIWNSTVYVGRGTLPGSYMYEDWNGDGIIDGNDVYPIRFNQDPWMNFGLTLNAAWKGLDMNIFFHASAMSSMYYTEQLYQPLWGHDESSAMEQFMDRWHPVDPTADPWDPATQWIRGYYAYTGSNPNTNSTFNIVNTAYLRLKTIELGYTLPVIKEIQNMRIFVNAYNLLTFTKVRNVDPEHTNDNTGYLYPLNKTVSVGLNITF